LEDLRSIVQDPEFGAPEPDGGLFPLAQEGDYEAKEGRTSVLRDLIRGSHSSGYLLGLIFVGGLLLGWLVIGWLLWPVQWTSTDPWHLRQKHQKTYIGLVAENFWWTKDIQRANEALTGWDERAVAELLATMEREACSGSEGVDGGACEQLIALAEALEVYTPEESLWASLLSQKTIFLSSILSALPLIAAVVLGVYSFAQDRARQAEGLLAEEEQLEEALEAMLVPGEGEKTALGGEQGQEQELAEKKKEEEEEKEREKEEEDYEEDEEEYEEEEESWVQDLVGVLFDEDETELSVLEAFCKKLPDVDLAGLLARSAQVADQLRRSNFLRGGEQDWQN